MMRTLKIASALVGALTCVSCQKESSAELETPASVGAEKGSATHVTWKSDGGSTTDGSMQAEVPGHGLFSGNYLQINSSEDAERAGQFFADAWYPGWSAWEGWGLEGGPDLLSEYSGKVITVMRSDLGEHMRCRFDLANPIEGADGGGIGECQLSNQQILTDVKLEQD
jgi:hypothetical protein